MEDVYHLGEVDGNAPMARTQGGVDAACDGIFAVNSRARSASLLTLPDLPLKSSARGIADEEEKYQTALWSLKQHCDTRVIQLFDVPAKSDDMSSIRRFSQGRVVVDGDNYTTNEWLTKSELSVCGRPMTNNLSVQLPRQSDIILPEKLDCNEDLRLSERVRPSTEQVVAQKGTPPHYTPSNRFL